MLLINAKLGFKENAVAKIIEIPGVINAYTVFGVYDIVAIVDVEDLRGFESVLKRINGVELMTSLVPDMRTIEAVEDPDMIVQRF